MSINGINAIFSLYVCCAQVKQKGKMTTENNALRPKIDQTIETGFDVLTHENETDKKQHVIRHVDASLIQFHFCFRGSATFHFNERTYSLPILD